MTITCHQWVIAPCLVLLVSCSIWSGHAQDVGSDPAVSFQQTTYSVNEVNALSAANVVVRRERATPGPCTVTLSVLNNTRSGFHSNSAVSLFASGALTLTISLFLVDDAIPEQDETIAITIQTVSLGYDIGLPHTAYVTILANDDPNGLLVFGSPGSRQVAEPSSGTTPTTFTVDRTRGLFNTVTAAWAVTSSSPLTNLNPTSGIVTFAANVSRAQFQVAVQADNIPENTQVFTLTLSGTTGGALLGSPSLVTLTIPSNDAPIHFAMSSVTSAEGTSVSLTLDRGKNAQGQSFGDISAPATVSYRTISGSATGGQDFTAVAGGAVNFASNGASATITIPINDDTTPELAEMFRVEIYNASTNNVVVAPNIATVTIPANDDQYGVVSFNAVGITRTLSEDVAASRSTSFPVQRARGTFGSINVLWRLENTDGSPVTSQFTATSGSVTIADGDRLEPLTITVIDDSVPEVAASYILRLVNVTGGGRLAQGSEGSLTANVVIADSDSAYGIVQFAADTQQSLTSVPRQVRLAFVRTGGLIGSLSFTYSVVYIPPGGTQAQGTTSFLQTSPSSVPLGPGASTATVSLDLQPNAVLEVGAMVSATILSVQLTSSTPVGAPLPSSPVIGSRSNVRLTVNASLANGPIGFSQSSLIRTVNESSTNQMINLQVSRQGLSGMATISWTIVGNNSLFTTADVGSTSGTVVINDGSDSTLLPITITADATPELDETFFVQLVSTSSTGQRLNPAASVAQVTIISNDNPGGFISFDSSAGTTFTVAEGGSVALTLRRTGGTLETKVVDMVVTNLRASGTGDILPSNIRSLFGVGEVTKTLLLAANNDNIPELDETFTASLTTASINQLFAAELIPPTSVTLVVPKNDDANGVIGFVTRTQIILESTTTTTYQTNYTIQRTGGLFGAVEVYWNVTAGPTPYNGDLTPVAGVVSFADGVNQAAFTVRTVQDQVPENGETFTLQLTSAAGGARLNSDASQLSATLLVQANDDPVFLLPPVTVDVEENSSQVILPVRRGGRANGVAVVSYSTINGTAYAGEDFAGVSGGQVTFANGEQTAYITINITDDSIPERVESFSVVLLSVTGDAVLNGQGTVTVNIQANDDTNGVIRFAAASLVSTVSEGNIASLLLERLGGTFSSVVLSWIIAPATGDIVGPATSGTVRFEDGSDRTFLNLTIVADNVPELEESFTVSLVSVLSGGASLSSSNIVANVTVPSNDDTNGVISVADASAMIFVDEDRPSSLMTAGSVNVTVQRLRGLFGEVRVAWEVVPSGTAALRQFVGLLLAGTAGPAVTTATPRPGTNGLALSFTGGAGSLVTVPQARQFPSQSIAAGFSIVCWVKLQSAGYLLSKPNQLGLVVFGLQLTAQSITVEYLPSGAVRSTLVNFPTTATLTNGSWYQVAVSVGSGEVLAFLDAVLIGRTSSNSVSDISAPLYVGARNNLGGQAMAGTVQDLRVYLLAFSISDLAFLNNNPAGSDLQPTSGYVRFDNSSSSAVLSISTVDDNRPEPQQTFTVRLLYVSGGGRFETGKTQSTLTVYKSDNSNGLFALASSSMSRTVDEGKSVLLEVVRTRGLVGAVRVTWQVSTSALAAPASADFSPASGTVDFADGQASQNITISASLDNVPELAEQFTLFLTAAQVLNEPASRTPTSGASLDTSSTQASVIISANDSPYGIFEFSTGLPATGRTFLPFATTAPTILLRESAGLVDIYIVRAQGTVGSATVEYTTSPGTAVGTGASPDYTPTAGRLDFQAGELFKTFQLRINDDSLPEVGKYFTLNLTNPQGTPQAPALGVGQVMTINLLPSDDAFGVLRFGQGSVSVIIAEAASSTVTLTVERTGGALGEVTVSWVAGPGATADLSPLSGNVTFPVNVVTRTFTLSVINDQIPETAELFTIHLTSVSDGGRLSSTGGTVATITVESSDDPHGAFQFTPDSQTYAVPEANGAVATLTVERLFGSIGVVELNYTTEMDTSAAANVRAMVGVDYQYTSGLLMFADNETLKTLNVSILVDTTPEVDETFRVSLGGVRLLSSPSSPPATNSPRLASPGSTAQVNINNNDDAFGVVQFSSTALRVTEPASPPVITVLRQAGSFGDIMVTWRATGGTATENTDFFPLTGTITIRANATSGSIPITISDDSTPEFDETFTIAIVSVAGGARIGPVSSATVTIAANDDPNGAFGFATASLAQSFQEPTAGTQPVTLTVQRSGGVAGVVTVSYAVSLAGGGSASADIIPVSGQVPFTSGVSVQTISLDIQPDLIPEINEVIQVQLVSAVLSTGAAIRIVSTMNTANITVVANDQPHGVVQFFPSISYRTSESAVARILSLTVYRSEGTFGDVRLTYRTRQLDLAGVAAALGQTTLDYFSVSAGQSITGVSTLIVSANRTHCANQCVASTACLAFLIHTSLACRLFTVVGRASSDPAYTLYTKTSTTALLRAQAQANLDFSLVTGSSIVVPAGQRQAAVSITVLSDSVPELNEYFAIDLQGVGLVTGAAEFAFNEPILGVNQSATVEITGNDDASGVFIIYATVNQDQSIRVAEQPNFALQMTIKRVFGTIGAVTVAYTATSGTATAGNDFATASNSISFADGVDQQSFFISINDDQIPEPDESFQVVLSSVSGGASISPSPNNSVTVVIADNDLAAGRVALDQSSMAAVVSEGTSFALTAVRSVASFGSVTVSWELSSEDANPSRQFSPVNGTVTFQPGQAAVNITIAALVDPTPEVAAVYNLTLLSVATSGISSVPAVGGAAVLDTTVNTATITLLASNNPHGVVALNQDSLSRTVTESLINVTLTIVREFGTIGEIIVFYEGTSINDSLTTVTPGQSSAASAGEDFDGTNRSVLMIDGQTSATIYVTILNDNIAELNEMFLVNLTGVTMVQDDDSGPASLAIPPRIGSPHSAEITIPANDAPNGLLHFAANSTFVSVSEDIGVVNLTVQRSQGLFGQVSVFFFAVGQSAQAGGVDFSLPLSRVLVFNNGEMFKAISIFIQPDAIPEVDEVLNVSLTGVSGGATVISPSTASVTILANDNANGIINILPASQALTLQEPVPGNSTGSSTTLTITRSSGAFGEVQVSWQVQPSATGDLVTTSGIITFLPGDSEKTIVITAAMDTIPELAEVFTIRLTAVTGGAALGPRITSNITITENSDPYGVLGVFFSSSASARSMNVEETVGTIPITVRRSQGAFGAVSVEWRVESGSAVAAPGSLLNAQPIQSIQTGGIQQWHSFAYNNRNYMLAGSENIPSSPIAQPMGNGLPLTSTTSMESALYYWDGQWLQLQKLFTRGARAWTSWSTASAQLVAVANYGKPGQTEVMSQVFVMLPGSPYLQEVQGIATLGAVDVEYFSSGGQDYLLFVNNRNNANSTHVNSALYRMDGGQFVPAQSIASIGGSSSDIFTTASGQMVLVIGGDYDSIGVSTTRLTRVYIWSSTSSTFQPVQYLDTNNAQSVKHFSAAGSDYVVVANSDRSDMARPYASSVFKFNTARNLFEPLSTLMTRDARNMNTFTLGGKLYLTVASTVTGVDAYVFNSTSQSFAMESQSLSQVSAVSVEPVTITTSVFNTTMLMVSQQASGTSTVLQSSLVSPQTDFIQRGGILTFGQGERERTVSVQILNDNIPEIDESFSVSISTPTGGSVVRGDTQLSCTILTNDNAHGLIGFDQSSLSNVINETNANQTVALTVNRERGTFGDITVQWVVTGDHNVAGNIDILPTSGSVTIVNGSASSTISLTVYADNVAELNEISLITLTAITGRAGVPAGGDLSRRATLTSDRTVSVLTVQANDEPHGVVQWSPASSNISVDERNNINQTFNLQIVREFGLIGDIIISYQTAPAVGMPVNQQATADVDYIGITAGSVEVANGVSTVSVPVVILHENTPELAETFYMNITDVRLKSESSRRNSSTSSPRLASPGSELASITIRENDESRGILGIDVALDGNGEFLVTEGTNLQLTVRRSSGSFGTIGCSWRLTGLTASLSSDVSGPLSGILTWNEREVTKTIRLVITNDDDPEIKEQFSVELFTPTGGARLGSQSSVVVAIADNDFANGLIGFTSQTQVVSVNEATGPSDTGAQVNLTIARTFGRFGFVNASWVIAGAAADLSPVSGSVFFLPNETSQRIVLRSLPDILPEGMESYQVVLTAVSGGAALRSGYTQATVVIPANDDAFGVLSIAADSRNIYTRESSTINVNIIRSLGTFMDIAVRYRIRAADTAFADDTATTFSPTDGSATFLAGVNTSTIVLRVLSDLHPEVARTYNFDLISVDNGGVVDASNSRGRVTVVASNNPHGTVQISAPLLQPVKENAGNISFDLQRSGGSIGAVRVAYTVGGGSATLGSDYLSLATSSVVMNTSVITSKIWIGIVNDAIPELTEKFFVQLTSIQLASGVLNTTVLPGGFALDIAPTLGTATRAEVEILANDDANGVIEFAAGSMVRHLNEESGMFVLQLVRSGGTFGAVTVEYYAVNDTAYGNGIDFGAGGSSTSGVVVFAANQTTATISLMIIDDNVAEIQEQFEIRLRNTRNGAVLGSNTESTITIAFSDDPSGVFGYDSPSLVGFMVSNPSAGADPRNISLTIVRSAGTNGSTTVLFDVLGADQSRLHTDILPARGEVQFLNGQRTASFILQVLADDTPELAEVFTVQLTGFAGGGGRLNMSLVNTTIQIAAHNNPHGVISFTGQSLVPRSIREPGVGRLTNISFSLIRNDGLFGSISVPWTVTGTKLADITPSSGVVVMVDGQNMAMFTLSVLPDATPELQHSFYVRVSPPSGGALLGAAVYSNFSIFANDVPHGLFQLVPGSRVVVDRSLVNAGNPAGRYISLSVSRSMGLIGNISVSFSVTFMESGSTRPMSFSHNVIAVEGQATVSTNIPVSQNFFFQPSSTFTIVLTGVSLASSGAASNPPLLGASLQEVLNIPELDSNSVCSFAPSSIQLAINDSATPGSPNVWATVTRTGLLGDASISWQSQVMGINTSNSILPATGSVIIVDRSRTMRFGVQTIADSSMSPVAVSLSLRLQSASSVTTGGARLQASMLQAAIEPKGVIRIAPTSQSLSVLESPGAAITITVWRQFGAMGNITVFYATRLLSSAVDQAMPGSDFVNVSSSFIMLEGQTVATIPLSIVNDNTPEDTEQFQVILMSTAPLGQAATVPSSPRLHNTYSSSVITITDDDDPAGVFSFSPASQNLQLTEGQRTTLWVQRDRGAFGAASVTVRTVLITSVAQDQRASVNDFTPLDTVLHFKNGQLTASVNLSIIDDAIPEINETFGLQLVNATGGARLSTLADGISTSVMIPGNDDQYGNFGFLINYTVTVNEDTRPTASLTILRKAGAFGTVTIHWIAQQSADGTAGGLSEQLVQGDGDVIFLPGDVQKTFTVTLRNDTMPEPATSFYIRLQSIAPAVKAVLGGPVLARILSQSNDAADGVYEFAVDSRIVVADLNAQTVLLVVTRPSGHSASMVECQPEQLQAAVTFYGQPSRVAVASQDFLTRTQTLTFDVGVTSRTCQVTLLNTATRAQEAIPAVFSVRLQNPSNLASLGAARQAEVVITYSSIVNQLEKARDMIESNQTPDFPTIMTDLGKLPAILQPGTGLDYFVVTVDRIIDRAPFCSQVVNSQGMMTLFDTMLAASVFNGRANTSNLVSKFAFTYGNCFPCPALANATTSLRSSSLNIKVQRVMTYSKLSFIGRDNTDRPSDTFTFPELTVPILSNCYTVHFIEYLRQDWFMPAINNVPVLNGKVLSVKISGSTATALTYGVTYRIYTSQTRVTNKGGSCVFWDHSSSRWSSETCTRTSQNTGLTLRYIECTCQRLPDLAARAAEDSRVGFGVISRVSCFVCLVALFVVYVLHQLAHRENMMIATKLFLHLVFAVMAFEIVLVASIYQASVTSLAGCFALGYLIHFLALVIFAWMAIMGYNFYRTFLFEDDDTERLYFRYVLVGWVLPTVITCVYIGVTIGGLSWDTARTYGDVHGSGDICFMTDIFGALFAGVAPIVILLGATIYFFVVLYVNAEHKAKWTTFDDFYLECDNGAEIPRLLLFYGIIFMMGVFGCLHISFSETWTEILFIVFNFITAAYALVMYTLIRLKALRSKGSFSPKDEQYPLGQLPTSLSTSKHSLTSLGSRKQLVLHRQVSAVEDPGAVRPYRPSLTSQQSYNGAMALNPDLDPGYPAADHDGVLGDDDGAEFDDLMYMLKTGGSLPPDEDDQPEDPQLQQAAGAASAEHYQMRRISIADTHL